MLSEGSPSGGKSLISSAAETLEWGVVELKSGRCDLALESFNLALELDPSLIQARFQRALALQAAGRPEEAVDDYDRVIEALPASAPAYMNRGLALKQSGRDEAALESLDHALQFEPDWAEAHLNRGLILKRLQRLEPAIESYRRALALDPDYAEAHSNLGVAQKELGQLDRAIPCFLRAIELKPTLGALLESGTGLSHERPDELRLAVLRVTLERGGHGGAPRAFSQPLWLRAEPLNGKTILLHCEQGLGDTIQFSRYATLVAQQGARVILEVQRPLVALLRGLQGVSQVVAQGKAPSDFDFHCPLLSLPLAFKTELHNIPAASAYLSVESGRRRYWESVLGEKRAPRVGLMWSGNPKNSEDYKRSLPLACLMKGLPRGPEYISLQKDVRDIDQACLASEQAPFHFGSQQQDFTNAAALCDLMDVVISVDTSMAHLAGALGKPIWIMLPSVPDWRWMLHRSDSPWYPSVRLYRQSSIGDWGSVFERIRSEMRLRWAVG